VKLTGPRVAPFSAATRDHARLALLFLVAIEVFVLPSVFSAGLLSGLDMTIVTGLSLIAGVVAVSGSVPVALVAGLLSVLALFSRILTVIHPAKETQLLDSLLTMLVVGLFAGTILVYVFGKERSTVHRMVGAIAVYLLIAVIFGHAYQILWLLRPGSLSLNGASGDLNDLLYFSFATLTTLGWGTPVGPFARALVSMEALVGQLYPAILIARLVSLPGPSRRGA